MKYSFFIPFLYYFLPVFSIMQAMNTKPIVLVHHEKLRADFQIIKDALLFDIKVMQKFTDENDGAGDLFKKRIESSHACFYRFNEKQNYNKILFAYKSLGSIIKAYAFNSESATILGYPTLDVTQYEQNLGKLTVLYFVSAKKWCLRGKKCSREIGKYYKNSEKVYSALVKNPQFFSNKNNKTDKQNPNSDIILRVLMCQIVFTKNIIKELQACAELEERDDYIQVLKQNTQGELAKISAIFQGTNNKNCHEELYSLIKGSSFGLKSLTLIAEALNLSDDYFQEYEAALGQLAARYFVALET